MSAATRRHSTILRSAELVAGSLAWSPDGQAIAYRRAGAGALEVLVLGEASPRLVTGAVSGGPSWSPDGSRLAFTTQEAAVSRLQVWDRANGRVRTLEATLTSFE